MNPIRAAPPKGEDLTAALEKATIDVTLYVVDLVKPNPRPILARGQGSTSRHHKTLRLGGLISELRREGDIDTGTMPRFYLRREQQHKLTKDGVIFEPLDERMKLKAAAERASPKRIFLELFLVLVPIREDFVVVTCGSEGRHSIGQDDVGEIIRPSESSTGVASRVLGQRGDVYRNPQTKESMPHETVRWEDLSKGNWVLPLQGFTGAAVSTSRGRSRS
ncbi:hypothetical protein FRB94_001875 [Tulasnella sp. JGI-2019a]|nr:hypothetical protein FRB94_001875 [Tulasnella sp. JGI-2019a]